MFAFPVRAQSIHCNGNATYSNGKVRFTCELTNVTGFYVVNASVNGIHIYKTSSSAHGDPIRLTVWFSIDDVVPGKFEILPYVTFSRLRLPADVSLAEYNDSKVVRITKTHTVLSLKFDPKAYLSLILGLLTFLFFFVAPRGGHRSGWDFATSVMGLQLFFRGGTFGWLIAPLVMPLMSHRALTDPRLGNSMLVLSGLTVIFLLQSIYALGMYRAKYPKIAFYTGLEWIPGLPLVFYFIWPDYYVTPLFVGFILSIPIFIILWKYAELPYSKCQEATSRFRAYSTPLSVGVALIIALVYTTEETLPLLGIFLISLVCYAATSKLAFEKLEWAKRRFDEDIEKIGRRWRRNELS